MPENLEIDEKKFYDNKMFFPGTEIQKIVSEKIREVLTPLFKKYNVNFDDFFFTAIDSKYINAFHINDSYNIVKNKTGIAVTLGMIEKLSCKEELAAVIFHEMGHDIWNKTIAKKTGDLSNSIIQERGADVNSVDLMIESGYNPQYITVMHKKLFGVSKIEEKIGKVVYRVFTGKKKMYKDYDYEVHGNDDTRTEDVKMKLASESIKKGNFQPINKNKQDIEYKKFKLLVKQIYKRDGYDDYTDKILKEKFGTKDLKKINREKYLRFLLELELNNNNEDLFYKIDFKNLSDTELKLIQKIVLKSFNKYGIQQYIIKHINIFGVFKEIHEISNKFIKNIYDKDKADIYYKKLKDIIYDIEKKYNTSYNFVQYIDSFKDFKKFDLKGFKKDNIGKRLPQDELEYYIKQNHPNDSHFFVLLFQDSHIEKDDHEKYYIENDIVKDYSKQVQKNKIKKQFDKECKEYISHIESKIEYFDLFAKYINDKISSEDLLKYYIKNFKVDDIYGNKFDNFFIIDIEPNININNVDFLDVSKIFNLYNKIKNSYFYDVFIKNSSELKYLKNTKNIYDVMAHIRFYLNYRYMNNFKKGYAESVLKFCNYLSKSEDINNQKIMSDLYKHISPGISYFSKEDFFDNKYSSLMSNFKDKYKYINIYNYKLGIDRNLHTKIPRKVSDKIYEETEKVDKNLRYKIGKSEFSNKYMVLLFSVSMQYAINNILKEKNSLEYIKIILKNFPEIPEFPKDEINLIKLLSYIGDYSDPDMEKVTNFSETGNVNLMYVFLAQYLKSGYKCNILNVINVFKNKIKYNDFNDIDEISEIFYRYINKDYFKSLDLMDKIRIYEFMDTRKLFSEKHANKNTLIKIISDELLQHQDKEFAVRIIFKILTRRNITEYGKISDIDFEFADEREKFIEVYTDYCANKLGKDDGSEKYYQRVKKFTDFLKSKRKQQKKDDDDNTDNNEKNLFSQNIIKSISDKISDKIVAQEKVAKLFGDTAKTHLNKEIINDLDILCRGIEKIFNIFAKNPECALESIKFLNNKITNESIQNLIGVCSKGADDKVENIINKETLTIIHENYWSADLKVRAVAMNRLLCAYADKDDDKKLQLIINNYFSKDSEYYKKAKIVLKSVYNNLQEYQRNTIMAALLSAKRNEDTGNLSNGQQAGRGLKMFFQSMGGAFVKFGQLLSYIPNLDSDMRKELSTLRDKADIPTRDELYDMMKKTLPKSEFNKISYVGKILGGGSIYLSVHVKYDGKDCVLALMRPFTHKKMKDGINLISDSVNDMTKKDPWTFGQVKRIVKQAKLSCESEIDIEQDYKKYKKAVKIYESLKVHTQNADYSPDVACWIQYGSDKNKENAFKIMEMAPGKSLTSMDIDEEDKHDMAMAYAALELTILLSGASWDTDRHAGQQNFYNQGFRDFCIGIFDTGAQMNKNPDKKDKIMLGYLLSELIKGAKNGKNIADVLDNKIKHLDRIGKCLGIDTVYIDGVQRGLIALSDIIEYQKEIKDEKGNIIQERRVLSEKDLENIVFAINKSGLVDKTIKKTIVANILLKELKKLRPGLFKKMSVEMENTDSEISIEYTGKKSELKELSGIIKPQEELDEFEQQQRQETYLGTSLNIVEIKNTNSI